MITAQHFSTARKGILTTLAVCLIAYMFIILLTYTANDPSWSHISSNMGQVSNMGGAVGAWLADLLYTFLGWSAWWLTVFIAFEAISLWWQRPQAFAALRVVGYVFVLFASCGLLTLLLQLLNVITATDIHYGGIMGVEVAYRLAHLLTPVAAAIFLAVFLLLTVTFVFNIHWRHLFSVTLGLSGRVPALTDPEGEVFHSDIEATADNAGLPPNELAQKGWQDTQDGIADHDHKRDHNHSNDDGNSNDVSHATDSDNSDNSDNIDASDDHTTGRNRRNGTTSPLFDQLALDLNEQSCHEDSINNAHLPPQHDQDQNQDQNQNAPFGNLLDEFLVGSGIGESLLNLQRQEAQEKLLKDGVTDLKSRVDSFNEQRVNQGQAPGQSDGDGDSLAAFRAEQDYADNANSHDASHDLSPEANNAYSHTSDPTQGDATEHTKKIAGFSFGAKAKSTGSSFALAESSESGTKSVIDIAADTLLDNARQDAQVPDATYEVPMPPVMVNPSLDNRSSNNLSPDNPTIAVNSSEQEAAYISNHNNTPPSNPAKPFADLSLEQSQTAPDEFAESGRDNSGGSNIAKASRVHFEVPDSEAGNYLEEMVPDSDMAAVTPLPDIHDDAAFMAKSRSMQTAKHRESLSPLPEMSILDKPDPDRKPSYTEADLVQLSELLEIKLQEFNVKAEVINAIPGPVVTRFEVELAPGIKASKVTGISRDLARSLSMATLRVVEVIPGKPYIGIEIPNKKRAMVRLIELLETEKYKDPNAQISMAMGMDIGGKPIITDLARAPHMLVAGTTGSGKSVLVNAMLLSMLLKYKPSELRLILIDPKQLELANYNDIPHLLTPVVTDMNEAASSLSWCVAEMERRYQLMSLLKVRKLNEFNKKVIAAEKAGRPMIDPLWRPNDSVSIDRAPKLKTLPMIVIVADEFADMIMQVGKQAEELITRLAQKSRAAGIHLMLATQRPSVDVITGLIKANIPVRAALRVNSKIDSRTILDAGGAEDMLGNGDMLFLGPGQIEPERVHGAYVSDEEVNRVCDAWRERGAPDYIDNMASNFELTASGSSGADNTSGEDDNLYDEAVAFVLETRKVSASSIQRKFSIGYNRAARIVDSMEDAGLVSSMGKSGKRELLM